jgi:hypothetical protein
MMQQAQAGKLTNNTKIHKSIKEIVDVERGPSRSAAFPGF